MLIDPQGSDIAVLQALLSERDLHLGWSLRTHHHDQSLSELDMLTQLGAPVLQGDQPSGLATRFVAEGVCLPFGDEFIRVLATPGHTPHCLSFSWRDRLFCGDVLAVDACPHQARPQQPQLLWESVTRKVFTLPDETLLFVGHERHARAVSTVLEQRRWHPFFAGVTRDDFLTRAAALQEDNRAVSV
ncbi:MAG: hypothetical protein PHH58_11470 [Rhodoferax sp.]|nr:hypothetical protein [Rhodoferax sp.]